MQGHYARACTKCGVKEDLKGYKKGNYFLVGLASFSRQVVITQAEKLVFSFFACSSICSISSWGKRIAFVSDLLLIFPVAIICNLFTVLVFRHYTTKNENKKELTCYYTLLYSVITPNDYLGVKTTIPRSALTLSRDLTKPLNGVMIMANRYDSAHLCAEQSKLFKFYDLKSTQILEIIATTERQARKNLGKQSLIFIARKRLSPTIKRTTNWGGYNYA